MSRDLHNNIKATLALAPVAASTNDTAFVSAIIDTAGFESTEFVGICGSLADTDATFAVLVEDGDNSALSDNAAVADAYLLGTEAGAAPLFSDDNKTFKIGYKGPKRYVRVTVTPSDNTGNVFLAGVWIQGHPRTAPQGTQKI